MKTIIDNVINDIEFLKIIKPILTNKEFQKRIAYKHFNDISMYEHALQNSYLDYTYAKKYHFNNTEIIEATIAGLLHNFYPVDKELKKQKPTEALLNSTKYFGNIITPNIADAIECHKFPYVPDKFPSTRVSALVNHIDSLVKAKNTSSKDNIEKHVSLREKSLTQPISFKQMHELFHKFLTEYNINIDKQILSLMTSFELRKAFYNYLVNLYPNINKNLLGEEIINTVKREELISKINYIIDNIKGYDINELSNNLNKKVKTKSQK